MKDPIIQYKNIFKSFGEQKVLNGINLDIYKREKIAIIGASGSGKTTMLRLLMTLEEPTSGKIIINGENLWEMNKDGVKIPANKKHVQKVSSQVGMVFQHFHLFPHLTALENCMISPVKIKKIAKSNAKKHAIKWLERVGLGDKLHSYPNQLSGGQQQRVAMARALTMNPKILLLDEVTSALDPELVDEVLEVIQKLAKTSQITMLLITHEIGFAKDIADRIVFLDEGIIAEEGSPKDVLNHSKNKRLQEFLNRFRKHASYSIVD